MSPAAMSERSSTFCSPCLFPPHAQGRKYVFQRCTCRDQAVMEPVGGAIHADSARTHEEHASDVQNRLCLSFF